MDKVKEILHMGKAEKHGDTTPEAHNQLQGANAHKQAGAQEGKAGAGHAKAGIGEKLSKNVAETKEKLHIGNKHGEATAAKEHHKANEKEHKAAAAGHAEKVADHADAGASRVDKAHSHETANRETSSHTTGHTTGVAGGTTGLTTGATTGTGAGVIDKKYYTATEDRPVDQEQVDRHREHNLYQKDFKQEVNATGRERQIGAETEVIGAAERVVGANQVEGDASRIIQANLPTGARSERPGGEGWVQGKKGPVCESTEFAVAGDRTVDKEHVTALKEHRNFEKEFEINTKLEGERAVGQTKEGLGSERNVVDVKPKPTPCNNHPTLGANDGRV
jgi:hypothetical protein